MTGVYSVRYSPAAKEDLKGIYSCIAYVLKERGTAARQVDRIRKAIRSLDADAGAPPRGRLGAMGVTRYAQNADGQLRDLLPCRYRKAYGHGHPYILWRQKCGADHKGRATAAGGRVD